jgi:hypothetical protein
MPDDPKTTQQNQQQVPPVQPPATEQGKGASEMLVDFETFLATQPEQVRKLYDTHVSGLKTALTSEREQGKTLQTRLSDIKKLFGSDPEKAKQEFDKLSEDYKVAQSRIEFLEEAVKPEVECLNPAAAWLVATGKGLFNSKGVPDWKAIREEAPQLFGKPTVRSHGGNGMGDDRTPRPFNMNDAVRENIQRKRHR